MAFYGFGSGGQVDTMQKSCTRSQNDPFFTGTGPTRNPITPGVGPSYEMGRQNAANANPKLMETTALGQKSQMQTLNTRLSEYMQRVIEMAQGGTPIDPEKYKEAMRILECEVENMKDLYERELEKHRNMFQEANRDKNALTEDLNKAKEAIDNLEKSLKEESKKARDASNQMYNMQRNLRQLDADNADMKENIRKMNEELCRLRPAYKQCINDNDQLKNKLNKELTRSQEAEIRATQLDDKANFIKQISNQENKDLQDRLKAANDIIEKLEDKIKELNAGEGELQKLLRKMKEETAQELRRHQLESEATMKKNLGSLKAQLDEDALLKEALKRERDMLEENLRKMENQKAELERQVNSLNQQNAGLNDTLAKEQVKAQEEIQGLQEKLKDLQGQLMDRVKDFSNARDAQASLQVEIGTYKNLLDTGDDKLANTPAGKKFRPKTAPLAFNNVQTGNATPAATGERPYSPGKSGQKPYAIPTNEDTKKVAFENVVDYGRVQKPLINTTLPYLPQQQGQPYCVKNTSVRWGPPQPSYLDTAKTSSTYGTRIYSN